MQGSPLANGTEKHAATNWNVIDWHQQARRVRNLRQRIFRATQAGDWKGVRSLQKLMLRSRANRLTSVRRVALYLSMILALFLIFGEYCLLDMK